MKKETIIATILGIGFGLVAAVVIIFINNKKELRQAKSITKVTITPKINIQSQLIALEIKEPVNDKIVNDNKITIKGKAEKDGIIVIQSSIKDIVFKNSKSDFSVDFPLVLGENQILIGVYYKDKPIPYQEKKLRVYYLDEQ